MAKSKDYDQMRLALDPNYLKKKQQKRLEKVNSDPYAFASTKYTKRRSSALKERGIAWRLDKEKTIKKIVESKTCALSGRTLVFTIGHDDSPSIDRINSNNGYTKSNIQIVTSRVNVAKNNMTDEEFIKMCVDVARHQGYIK